MEVTINELWLIIATMEETGLHHRNNAEKMAEVCRNILGSRPLAKFFCINKSEVLPRLRKYIYNHEY